MRKPNVIQATAGTTLMLSMGANAWYAIDFWHRGGAALIVAGVWMPISIVLLERMLHAMPRLGRAVTVFAWLAISLVAAACMYYSMSHLAHLATPEAPSAKEVADGWIFAASVDIVMLLSGVFLALARRAQQAPAPEPQVIEKIVERVVEVQVPVEVEKLVYIEVPAKREALHVEAHVEEVEETETITETRREVTRTARRSSLTAEQEQQIYELGMAGVKPADILRKLSIEGKQTNYITRSAVWSRVKEQLAQIEA